MTDKLPEVWLRGPVAGVPPPLQPVAHALLQAREEVEGLMQDFPEPKLWEKPAGVASVGFHLQHFAGVLSRLFTYARGESLDAEATVVTRLDDPFVGALSDDGSGVDACSGDGTSPFIMKR